MKQHHALDIPELRISIAAYLNQDSLKACVCVSRAWYSDFTPFLWARFSVDSCRLRESQRKLRAARLESLSKHARWIKHLGRRRIRSLLDRINVYTILVDHCRSLDSLDIGLLDEEEWDLYRQLVALNPDLCQVTIPSVLQPVAGPIDYQPSLLLCGLARLTRLVIDCPTTLSALVNVLEVCPSIEQLVIGSDNSGTGSRLDPPSGVGTQATMEGLAVGAAPTTITTITTTTPPSRTLFMLRQLKLEIPCSDPGLADMLLARCSLLEQLGLDQLLTDEVYSGVCRLLTDSRLPHLTSLSLRNSAFYPEMQRAILGAFPPHQLRMLALSPVSTMTDIGHDGGVGEETGATADEDIIRLLVRCQHQSLEHLHLALQNMPPESMSAILTSCQRLKVLVVRLDQPVDIRCLIDQPWACTNLEELSIFVALNRRPLRSVGGSDTSSDGVHLPSMTFSITAIENAIETEEMPPRHAAASDLTFTLANGLEHLAKLIQLEEVTVGDRGFRQSETELQFMKDHWPQMKRMTFYSLRAGVKRWLRLRWPEVHVVDLKNPQGKSVA
ncbi:hypothetical protein DFQ26_007975 [Actinomortierella ambigua]|nr:hypothetical protein DFQ26_007975 [Actinomortierella ambigua]